MHAGLWVAFGEKIESIMKTLMPNLACYDGALLDVGCDKVVEVSL